MGAERREEKKKKKEKVYRQKKEKKRCNKYTYIAMALVIYLMYILFTLHLYFKVPITIGANEFRKRGLVSSASTVYLKVDKPC